MNTLPGKTRTGVSTPRTALALALLLSLALGGCSRGTDKKKEEKPDSPAASASPQTRPPNTPAAVDDGEGERYLRVEERLRRRQQRILDELNRAPAAPQ